MTIHSSPPLLNGRISLSILLLLAFVSWAHAATYVVAWGDNTYGQLLVPEGLTNAAAIAAGGTDCLVVTSDNRVVAWGSSGNQTNLPTGLSNVVALAGGYGQVLALKQNGSVVAWGADSYGEASVPGNLTNAMAIAAGSYHSLALRSNGTVVAWGYPDSRIAVPAGLTNVLAVGASAQNSLALKSDGTLSMWGPYGPDTLPPSGLSNVGAISGTFLALKGNGQVVAWGNNSYGQTNVPAELTNAIAIAGNGAHNLALKPGGALVAWGHNSYGEATVPPGLTNIVGIAVGGNASFALVSVLDGSPVITRHPVGQNVYSGTSVTLSLRAEGAPAPTYQWQVNGTNLPGASEATLTLTNVQVSNSGAYRATASNILGTATSVCATLTVVDSPPQVVFPPRDQTVVQGATATLALPFPATGSWPLSYQWRFNNVDLPGATDALLTFTNVLPANEGSYRLVVRNPYGALTTTSASLTVIDLGEAVDNVNLAWLTSGDALWQPLYGVTSGNTWGYVARSGPITHNQSSTLQTTLSGPGTLTFWWKVCSQPELDYLSFSINHVEQARISGSLDWQKQTIYLAPGSNELRWQYAKDASGSSGEDTAWLDQVSFAFGATTPVVSLQPANQTVTPGATVTFSVTANGTPPLSFQWQRNGLDIPGLTGTSLTLTNVQLADNGSYRVVVSNAYGSISSANALLNVFVSVGPAQPQDALDRWYFRSPSPVKRVRYVGGLFIGLGAQGLLTTSPDGVVWTTRNSGTTATLNGVAYGTGSLLPSPYKLFVVVGSGGTLLTSPDAVTWSPVAATTQDLNDVAWNGSRFAATTTAYAYAPTNVFYTLDSLHWTGVTFPSNPDTGYPFITSTLGVVNGYFVTAGGSAFAYNIWRSSLGSTWRNVGFSDAVVGGIASGNGCAIIVGYEGWPRVSTDQGATWTASASSVIDPYAHQPPTYSLPMVGTDMAFGNGVYLVARGFMCNGFLTTPDGVTWSNRNVFVGSSIDSVAYGNGTFVVSCSGGAYGSGPAYPVGLYQSSPVAVPFMTLARQTNPAAVVLTISGELGRAYRLQYSSDLKTWNDRSNYTYSATGFQCVDPVPSAPTQRFYRVVSP